MVVSIHTEKAFDKNLIFFYDKRPEESSGHISTQQGCASLFSVVLVSTMTKNGIERILGLFHLTGHSPLVRKSVQDPKQGRYCGGQQLPGSLSYTAQTH